MYRICEHVPHVHVKVAQSEGQFICDLDASTKCRDTNLARIGFERRRTMMPKDYKLPSFWLCRFIASLVRSDVAE